MANKPAAGALAGAAAGIREDGDEAAVVLDRLRPVGR
jgi:hypothetical protein